MIVRILVYTVLILFAVILLCRAAIALERKCPGEKFDEMRPDHYGDGRTAGESSYRKIAYANYEKKCACCGYDEDVRILQVHHRDENHSNNAVENLVILCPNCHWKLTLHLYDLTEDNQLIPIK